MSYRSFMHKPSAYENKSNAVLINTWKRLHHISLEQNNTLQSKYTYSFLAQDRLHNSASISNNTSTDCCFSTVAVQNLERISVSVSNFTVRLAYKMSNRTLALLTCTHTHTQCLTFLVTTPKFIDVSLGVFAVSLPLFLESKQRVSDA